MQPRPMADTSRLLLPSLRFCIGFSFEVHSGGSCYLQGLWAQQRLDRAALVHGAVALRHLVERQSQVKDPAGVDFLVPYQIDQLGQVAPYRRGSAVEVD